jgi:hypothetical protein
LADSLPSSWLVANFHRQALLPPVSQDWLIFVDLRQRICQKIEVNVLDVSSAHEDPILICQSIHYECFVHVHEELLNFKGNIAAS